MTTLLGFAQGCDNLVTTLLCDNMVVATLGFLYGRTAHLVRMKTAKFGKLKIIDTITSDCKEIGFLMDFNPKGQIKLM